ncbi:hypothetical protein [Terasakiella sp.]|uniref:hypothetical protein n=1 Tax=Terasakiella sp. TaxID=2034861 RepID=UPI003AA9AC0E
MWVLAFVLICLLFAMAVSGCGSKKKLVEIEKVKVETSSEETVEAISQNDIKTTQETLGKTETETETENETFSGEVANTSKVATVTVEKKDGKTVRTYYNFKTVNQGESKTKETVKDTFGQNLSKTDLSKIDISIEAKSEERKATRSVSKDLEVKRGFPWWILILVLVVYGVVSYFRGMNPLKWFS